MKPFDLQINATIGSESRQLPAKPKTLKEAVKLATAYAEKHRGTKAVVQVSIPEAGGLYDRAFTLFEVSYPALDDWMKREVKKHYGRQP